MATNWANNGPTIGDRIETINGVITAGKNLVNDPNVNSAGDALIAAGNIAMNLPAPAGPIAKATISMVGSFFSIFTGKEPSPSEEMLALNQIGK